MCITNLAVGFTLTFAQPAVDYHLFPELSMLNGSWEKVKGGMERKRK